MAPLPPAPNTLRIRVLFSIGGKLNQGLRFFFSYTGLAPTGTACEAIAAAIFSNLTTAGIATLLSTSVKLMGVIVEDLSSPTTAAGEYNGTVPGIRAGVALPADAAFVSSYEIARRYRGGHPRSYWPFGVDTDLTGPQAFKPDSVIAFQDFVNLVMGSLTGLSHTGTELAQQVNVSYYKGFTAVENPLTGRYRNVPTLRAAPVIANVTNIIGRSYLGSFRKRRFKTS